MTKVWNSISRAQADLPACEEKGTTSNCYQNPNTGSYQCVPCDPNKSPSGPSDDCSQPNSQPDYSNVTATKNCHKFRFLPQPCGKDWIEYCSGDCGVYPCWLEHPWLAFTDTLDGGMEYAVLPLTLAGVATAFYFLR